MHQLAIGGGLVLTGILSSCTGLGTSSPVAPGVEVLSFQSTHITPDAIEFEGVVVIRNHMDGTLHVDRVDFGAALHDHPLFRDSLTQLHPMRAGTLQTVTLPFKIPMDDIADQVEHVLAEEAVRVSLHGAVFAEALAPVTFERTAIIPLPTIPAMAIHDVRGDPARGEFTILLSVLNDNDFALTLDQVDTFLELNGVRYPLLRAEDDTPCIEPGSSGRVALTLRQQSGAALQTLLNMARSGMANITVGGTLSCESPYGTMRLPLEVGTAPASPLR